MNGVNLSFNKSSSTCNKCLHYALFVWLVNNCVDSKYVLCLTLMYLSVSDYVMHVSEERFLSVWFYFLFLLGLMLEFMIFFLVWPQVLTFVVQSWILGPSDPKPSLLPMDSGLPGFPLTKLAHLPSIRPLKHKWGHFCHFTPGQIRVRVVVPADKTQTTLRSDLGGGL